MTHTMSGPPVGVLAVRVHLSHCGYDISKID